MRSMDDPTTPCPWCGAFGYLTGREDLDSSWVVRCKNFDCAAEGPARLSPMTAFGAWEARTPTATHAAALRVVEAARKMVGHEDGEVVLHLGFEPEMLDALAAFDAAKGGE